MKFRFIVIFTYVQKMLIIFIVGSFIMQYVIDAGQHHNLLSVDKSFEVVEKFKYLGRTTKLCIHEEIKSRRRSGIPATIQFRIFCLPVSSIKTCLLNYLLSYSMVQNNI